jgi:hypothetical protein
MLPCPEMEFQMSRKSQGKRFMQDTPSNVDENIWGYCVESAAILGQVTNLVGATRDSEERDNEALKLGRWIEEWWGRLSEQITSPANVKKDEVGSLILLHSTYNTYLHLVYID